MAKRSGSSGDGGRGGQGELGPGKPTWQNFVHVYLTEHLRMRHRKDVPAFTAEAYEVAAPLPGAVSRRKGTAMAVRSILCDLARGLPAHPTPGEGQRYIQGQIDSGRLAGSTANAWLKYAGRVCRYARGWWPTVAVRDWPMDLPAFPEKRREVRAIANPAESIPRILASVPGLEERALLLVMLELGLRIGEAHGLWWGDFDWRRATVTLHRQLARGEWAPLKSQRAYATMPIPPRAGELLVEL